MYFFVLKILFLHRKIYFYVLKFYFQAQKSLFHGLKILSLGCKETFYIRFQEIVWPEMKINWLRFRSKPVHPQNADRHVEMEEHLNDFRTRLQI